MASFQEKSWNEKQKLIEYSYTGSNSNNNNNNNNTNNDRLRVLQECVAVQKKSVWGGSVILVIFTCNHN